MNHTVWGNGIDAEGTPLVTPPDSATGNSVTVNSGGSTTTSIYGGFAESSSNTATAGGNSVTINDGSVPHNESVQGGYARSDSNTATTSGNSVTINSGSIGSFYGGRVTSDSNTATASGNSMNINGGSVLGVAYGGYANSTSGMATASGNSVNMNGGSVSSSVFGGHAYSTDNTSIATASGNSVTINGGSVNTYVDGGNAQSSDGTVTASSNSVTINGGSVGNNVRGGYAYGDDTATAGGNSVTINGGSVNGSVYGGYAYSGIKTATATGNSVTITGNPTLGAGIYGGYTAASSGTAGDAFSGNTLNFRTSGLTVTNVLNFENLNFSLPSGFAANQPVLTVTGTANLTDGGGNVTGIRSSKVVNVDIDVASSPLKEGDTVTLISAGQLVTNTQLNAAASGMQGVSLLYDFDISATSTQLLANVAKISVNPQTKAFSEAWLSQIAFTNQGADLIAGQGLFAALDATADRTEQTTTTFGTLSGGTSRYKTGSHSDVSGVSLLAGLAGSTRQPLGKLTLGAFFEYGDATYDTYNSFINVASVRGRGGLDYTGGGVLAHLEFNPTATGNAWLESSARFGEASVDFRTNDMGLRQHTAFASNSNYAAAHFGAGYHWNLTKRNGFDLYAQYLWSRQNADTVTLTTGESVNFDEANSERLRLGSRFVYGLNSSRRAYAGIAWEHEFDGEANASVLGYRLDAAKLTGDTCKLELGFALLPTKACRFTRDFGLQGYAGKREGVAGSVEVRYAF